ncbi:polysaccharide deacetylase family protein [Candidatus Thioglobus autotrophicus]|uniref:polysaccharide deacetylase family protein n=1 Tax=Candidatus Thioglobus autotrophicus TaxID=1705394 RepID=UPI00299E5D30|nr:polysaccharide deacetylase family protein [Candidatus Thioglobus autotrophicus]WPE16245.1 polysaccharide deacetylase family protein [Candidatus Thioglobus autotrophicus]
MNISIIGRLTGPKGDIAYQILSKIAPQFPAVKFNIAGGPVTSRFEELASDNIEFYGFVDNVPEVIKESDLVIGAGRVAVEALQLNTPILAIGEKQYMGILDKSNIKKAQISNFGDCALDESHDFKQISKDLKNFIQSDYQQDNLSEVVDQYSPEVILPKINQVYSHALTDVAFSKQKEAAVVMYHRVVNEPLTDSKFNVYITKDKLDWQLGNLKKRGFDFITFKDLANGVKAKKPIILTFDDGYEDNYLNLLPLLKKHQAKAVIYCLGDCTVQSNTWDEKLGEPCAHLMSDNQIKECHDSGLVEIASHGLKHQHLPGLIDKEAREEFELSKSNLESLINDKVVSFAYPYGDYGDREEALAYESGYDFAIGTVNGPLKLTDNYYAIRRIQIFPNEGKLGFWKKTSGFYLRLCKLKSKDF